LFVHTKFKNLAALSKSYPEPLAIIHVKDAADRGVAENEMVEVTSPQGSIRLKAKLAEDMNPGLVLVDFGWGNPTDGKASINRLTNDTYFDPISGGTPNRIFPCEVKVCQNRPSQSGA
jgi:anaerobic selenocysteine-containing dehydrogenase